MINLPHPKTDIEHLQRALLSLLAETDGELDDECSNLLKEALVLSSHLFAVVHPDGRHYRTPWWEREGAGREAVERTEGGPR